MYKLILIEGMNYIGNYIEPSNLIVAHQVEP